MFRFSSGSAVRRTGSDVIAAEFMPGFTSDLTYWRVFIGCNRWLRQEVGVWDPGGLFDRELLRYEARLSRAEMAELWGIIDRIGFRDFNRRYSPESICVTDCPNHWIIVRFDKQIKEVEAYDLFRLTEFEKNQAMIGFRELWEAIHRRTPHGKVPMEEGLPKPWWRFW